jgi:short-subunit dehydrogenase
MSKSPFADTVALITGAASGIGRQLALFLAEEGARVAGLDVNAEALATLETDLSRRGLLAVTAVGDVTDRESLQKAVRRLHERLGPTDLLIASAGIGMETSALKFRAADVEATLRVNLIGVANSIDAVLPGMLERRRGHLVAISSLASFRGLPRLAAYCASKSGVNALMDALRVELKPRGVWTTTICPGWIRTPMTAGVAVPMPGLMEVEDAARRMLQAIRKRRPFYAFPWRTALRLRLMRWLPGGLCDRLIARALRGR